MSGASNDAQRSVPMNPALDVALSARADGDELRAVYGAIPAPEAQVTPAQRDAAWSRLAARLHDPARTPYTDDAPPHLELVRDDVPSIDRPAHQPLVPSAPVSAAPAVPVSAGRRPPVARRFAIAAALVVTVGGVWANGEVTHALPAGGQPVEIALADGSRAWLAPGSALSHARRLGWPGVLGPRDRSVTVRGTAFFSVWRDGRAFRVRTPDATVEVLGTRFEVQATGPGHGSRVRVEEGRVGVRLAVDDGRAATAPVILGAGEAAVVRGRVLTTHTVPVARVASWRTGGLAALDEPLADVLDELARRYNVDITTEPGVNGEATVSLFYPAAPSVDTVLADLCTAQGLVFRRTSRGYTIAPL